MGGEAQLLSPNASASPQQTKAIGATRRAESEPGAGLEAVALSVEKATFVLTHPASTRELILQSCLLPRFVVGWMQKRQSPWTRDAYLVVELRLPQREGR